MELNLEEALRYAGVPSPPPEALQREMEDVAAGLTAAIVKGLSIGELEEMAQALQRMADAKMPVTPQLAGRSLEKTERAADDRAFYI